MPIHPVAPDDVEAGVAPGPLPYLDGMPMHPIVSILLTSAMAGMTVFAVMDAARPLAVAILAACFVGNLLVTLWKIMEAKRG